nr:hypothetical protein [Tanacetum cinerariifolium]
MVEGQENIVDDSSIPRNAKHNIPGTRLEPRSDKESPEVEFTDMVIPVNVYDEEEEEDKITDEVYELKRKEKGKNVEESRITPFPTPIRSPRIHTDLVSSDTEKLQELTELQGRYGYLFEHLRAKFMPRKSFVTLADHLHKAMANSLPTMVDKHIKEQVQQQVPEQQQDIAIWLALQMKFERLQVPQTTCRTPAVRPRDRDDPHDDAYPEGENSAKRQKTSEYEAYVSGESSSSVIWERVHDFQLGIESYQQKVNLTAPTISFLEIEKHEMFSIIYEPVHGIIYKNSKKEKRVMRHSEIHKFCDATLNRVLEGLKSYNNDVKYGYIQRDLTKDEVEYLKLFEEEIEDRLKYRRQMR